MISTNIFFRFAIDKKASNPIASLSLLNYRRGDRAEGNRKGISPRETPQQQNDRNQSEWQTH